MRSASWMLGTLAVASAGLFACSSSISDGTLPFTIAEGLLLVVPEDPTRGAVALSSTTGNCPRLQTGTDFSQIANSAFLYFLLGELDANNAPLPLDGGTYTIVDPVSGSFDGPGSVANGVIETTNVICVQTASTATEGSVTVSPFNTSDGGVSSVSYSAVFDSKRITGTYPLSTCPISASLVADAGTCLVP